MNRRYSMPKIKTRTIGSVALLLAFVLFLPLFGFGCIATPAYYTEEEHLARVTERAREYYLTEVGTYTDLEVFPLYNANDQLTHFVVELKPMGVDYIKISSNMGIDTMLSMYYRTVSDCQWKRYRLSIDGTIPAPYEGKQWREARPSDGVDPFEYENKYFEVDDNDQFIVYNDSYYKVGGVLEERRYFLPVSPAEGDQIIHYIPSVRRGDKYFNLISMEEFTYSDTLNSRNIPCAPLNFIVKNGL